MIDRWFPGYVDAYYGPQEVRESINARDKPSIETLEDLAGSIQRSLLEDSALSPNRRAYLQEELRAMCTTIQILAGNPPDYINEVESLYGVTPKWVDESIFAEAHHVLNEVPPGSGSLRERVMGFKERSRVPSEVAEPIIRRLVELLRGRTVALFGLPPGEDCEVTFVRDKPWIAYNWYLGDYKSHINFNQDVPIEMWNLPYAIAHEMYPGHHTEFAIKEQLIYRGEGRPEHSILLSNTPSSLVSEGIAENGLEAIENEDAALPQDDAAV